MSAETELSVSKREAEQQYPTQYWEGTKIKRSFDMTTDDLQDAYMCGREAEPCKEQIEAVTRLLWEDSRNLEPFEEVADAPEIIDEYRRWASTLLEAARKAVM